MIKQEINLYHERFREPRLILSAIQSLALLVFVFILLAVGSIHYDSLLSHQQALKESREQEKQTAEVLLAANRQKLEAELADSSLDQRLQLLLRDIDARKRLVRFVDNNSLDSGEGFSTSLEELAELSIDDVWLNEITLADNFVRLSGSALKAENIPLYFSHFKQQKQFVGQVFDIFEVKRDQTNDWKVDFIIASRAGSQ